MARFIAFAEYQNHDIHDLQDKISGMMKQHLSHPLILGI